MADSSLHSEYLEYSDHQYNSQENLENYFEMVNNSDYLVAVILINLAVKVFMLFIKQCKIVFYEVSMVQHVKIFYLVASTYSMY